MEKLSVIMLVIGGLTLLTNIITEVLKQVFTGFPTRIAVFAIAMAVSVLAAFVYSTIYAVPLNWLIITAAVVLGFFVSYAAQFGYDKLKEMIEKYFGGGNNGD